MMPPVLASLACQRVVNDFQSSSGVGVVGPYRVECAESYVSLGIWNASDIPLFLSEFGCKLLT